MPLDRTDNSVIGRWWWTVDRITLGALVALVALGAVMVVAASPPVAHRLHLAPFYFVKRHQLFLLLGLVVMIVISFLPPVMVRRGAVVGFVVSLLLMAAVLVVGTEIKGAHRWLSFGSFALQPSEFMKPCFAVVMAWVCAQKHRRAYFPGHKIAIGLYALVVSLLLAQPDFGMTMAVSVMWGIQFFLAGLPLFWVPLLAVLGLGGIYAAYNFFPHVEQRINSFIDPSAGDNYQVEKSLQAFANGGIFGQGPGEGTVKNVLPDSHTDFVFAVAGEEFGMIFCLFVVSLFALVVLRSLVRVWQESDIFILLAVAGLATQFGVQAIVNIGVAMQLLPAKGMTLPFLSYGGSSVLAIAVGMGMLLAFTRRRYGMNR